MTVSKEEVEWAYKLILDRLPESDDAVLDKTRKDSLRELIEDDMLISNEFIDKNYRTIIDIFAHVKI
jgi:hypothetical protein